MLHPLTGSRKGTWAVRVSGNWRVTFSFIEGHAVNVKDALQKAVIPAKAGIQVFESRSKSTAFWIPAFAGMTPARLLQSILNYEDYH